MFKTNTSSQWAAWFGFIVIDPDGWDSRKEDFNGSQQLTITEFIDRLVESTIAYDHETKFYDRRVTLRLIMNF